MNEPSDMMVSVPTKLKALTNTATSFTTNILVVGGAYAGLAAVKSFINHINCRVKDPSYNKQLSHKKISITLVEPKSGFLNILGIPKAIVDYDFARTQFVPFEHLDGLKFDKIIAKNENVLNRLTVPNTENSGEGFVLNYVHGKITYLDDKIAQYVLIGSDEKAIIDFDYVVYGTGRNRPWPTTPEAYTEEYYLSEMSRSISDIGKSDIISVIGAGAVGIEIAGDIKNEFPNKTVNLIHPHSLFPAEPLSEKFKKEVYNSLVKAGVTVHLNTRISKELDNGDLLTTTGDIIKSNLNYWCISHINNTHMLSSDLKKSFVTSKNNIAVNDYLQLDNGEKIIKNFFAIGDLVELPIIKSAGWAMYMGRQCANNIISLILDKKLVEPFPDITQMPRGMVLVAGNGEIVSELSGEVELNHKGYVQEYKDYCIGKIRATLGV